MRLISLTANKDSFHPIYFRRDGITLIVGSQSVESKRQKEKTYNGVGKSLIVAIIHFCLGSNKIDEFESKLPGWEFTLAFEHAGNEYNVSRSTSDQSKIDFDGREVGVRELGLTLEPMMFELPKAMPSVTFRSLLSYFIRGKKDSYVAFDRPDAKATPYESLIRIGFLLGLDIDLIAEKARLRKEKEHIREHRENIVKDPVFKEYFAGDGNPDIGLHDLDREASLLAEHLASFRVAEDYHARQVEADDVRREVQDLRNELVVLRDAQRNIDVSLGERPDLDPADVEALYADASRQLPEMVVKTLHQVTEFHHRLLVNRTRRLTEEKRSLEREVAAIEGRLGKASKKLDALVAYLGSHGALDEFVANSNRLSDVRGRAQKLRDYRDLLGSYQDRIEALKVAMSQETIKASAYLRDARPIVESNLARFRAYSEKFYGDRPGGLTVANNEGDNMIRFNVDAHIEDDASDGINEVKIFCFDATVLTGRHRHGMEFVFHDSRLFSNMDVRQRAACMRVAREMCDTFGLQYIATLNQDQVDSMRGELTADEYDACIDRSVVLRLTDKDPSTKLLGVQVDMQY